MKFYKKTAAILMGIAIGLGGVSSVSAVDLTKEQRWANALANPQFIVVRDTLVEHFGNFCYEELLAITTICAASADIDLTDVDREDILSLIQWFYRNWNRVAVYLDYIALHE